MLVVSRSLFMWEGVETVSDATRLIQSYFRDRWTLADLRALVSEVGDWDSDSEISLVSVDPAGRRGAIQVSRDED